MHQRWHGAHLFDLNQFKLIKFVMRSKIKNNMRTLRPFSCNNVTQENARDNWDFRLVRMYHISYLPTVPLSIRLTVG